MININNKTMITSKVELAVAQLHQGEVVGMPTETVYGLAADARCDKAIKKIFSLKKRPTNHPLIMHVAHEWDLNTWAKNIPAYVFTLIEQFWPGPLTLVLNMRPEAVSSLLTGGQHTVAIRCPNHPVAQEVLNQLGSPFVAPSANLFGKISPTTAKHVYDSFEHDHLLILDGGRCRVGIESTLILATEQNSYQILRHGTIDQIAIDSIISKKQIHHETDIRTPGKLLHHYEPEKPLFYIDNLSQLSGMNFHLNKRAYILSFSSSCFEIDLSLHFSLPTTPDDAAHELYYQLRRADQSRADFIVIELPPNEPPWQGIRERIIKAGRRFKG